MQPSAFDLATDGRDPFDEMDEVLGPERPRYHGSAHGLPDYGTSPPTAKRERKTRSLDNGDLLTEDWAAQQFAERRAGQLLYCHDTRASSN